jgi:hypothetical protein
MNLQQYRTYYLDLILGTLGGNRTHFDLTDETGDARTRSTLYLGGLTVLALVSLIEANFLSKQDLKAIRNFGTPTNLPPSVNRIHLSCYTYIRDCFAHNPEAKLLTPGSNTTEFLSAIQSGQFPFCSVSNNQVRVTNTHELHLIVLRFFGEAVRTHISAGNDA